MRGNTHTENLGDWGNLSRGKAGGQHYFKNFCFVDLYTKVKQLQALSLWPLLPPSYTNTWEQISKM